VYVWVVGHERVHARRVGPHAFARGPERASKGGHALSLARREGGASPDEHSATLEAAALVVRGAVRAVSFEREGRSASEPETSLDEPARAPPPEPIRAAQSAGAVAPAALSPAALSPPAPSRARAFQADHGAAESSEREPQGPRWSPRAGLDWSHAGLNPGGFWSASAGLDVRVGALSAGASASLGFVEPAVYRGVAFELDRRTLLAEVGWAVLQRPSFALRPKLGAGAAWLTRTTTQTAWGGAGEPVSTSLSPLVTGDLVAEYQLAGPLALELHAGLRWFAHTTRYIVKSPEGDVPLVAGWRWQPNAGIALGAAF
jgi:hypothetical protein